MESWLAAARRAHRPALHRARAKCARLWLPRPRRRGRAFPRFRPRRPRGWTSSERAAANAPRMRPGTVSTATSRALRTRRRETVPRARRRCAVTPLRPDFVFRYAISTRRSPSARTCAPRVQLNLCQLVSRACRRGSLVLLERRRRLGRGLSITSLSAGFDGAAVRHAAEVRSIRNHFRREFRALRPLPRGAETAARAPRSRDTSLPVMRLGLQP